MTRMARVNLPARRLPRRFLRAHEISLLSSNVGEK